jgi:hypothetical protein
MNLGQISFSIVIVCNLMVSEIINMLRFSVIQGMGTG